MHNQTSVTIMAVLNFECYIEYRWVPKKGHENYNISIIQIAHIIKEKLFEYQNISH